MKPKLILTAFLVFVIGSMLLLSCTKEEEETAGLSPVSQPAAPTQWHTPILLETLNSSDENRDDWQISLNDDGRIMFFSTQNLAQDPHQRCPYGMHSVALRGTVEEDWRGAFVGSDGCATGSIIGVGGGVNSSYSRLYYVSGPEWAFPSDPDERPGALPDYTSLPQSNVYRAYRQRGPIDSNQDPELGDFFVPPLFLVGGFPLNHPPDFDVVEGASDPAFYETTPGVDDSGEKLYFARSADGSDFDIYRIDLGGDPNLEAVPEVNSQYQELYPYVAVTSYGWRYLYFASDRPGGNGEYVGYLKTAMTVMVGVLQSIPAMDWILLIRRRMRSLHM